MSAGVQGLSGLSASAFWSALHPAAPDDAEDFGELSAADDADGAGDITETPEDSSDHLFTNRMPVTTSATILPTPVNLTTQLPGSDTPSPLMLVQTAADNVRSALQNPDVNTDRGALNVALGQLGSAASAPVHAGVHAEAGNILQHGFNGSTSPDWAANARGLRDEADAAGLGTGPDDAALRSNIDQAVQYMEDPGLTGSDVEQTALHSTLQTISDQSGRPVAPATANWASEMGRHVAGSDTPLSVTDDLQGLDDAAGQDGYSIGAAADHVGSALTGVETALQDPAVDTDRSGLTTALGTLKDSASAPVHGDLHTEADNILQHGFNSSTKADWAANAEGLRETADAAHLGNSAADIGLRSNIDQAIEYMNDPGLSGSLVEQGALKTTLQTISDQSGRAVAPSLANWASEMGRHVATSSTPISVSADLHGLTDAANQDGYALPDASSQ